MKLNKVLKDKRLEYQLTQEQVAEKIFVSNKTISNWENGKTIPDIENVILLAKLFDLSLDSLLKEDDDVIKQIEKESKLKRYLLLSTLVTVPIFIILINLYSIFSYPYIEMLLRPFHLGFIMDSNFLIISLILSMAILIGGNIFQLLNKKINKQFIQIQHVFYTITILFIFLFKSIGVKGVNLNIISFFESFGNSVLIILINIILFIPFGIYATIKNNSYPKTIIYSLIYLLGLECIQYFFSLGIADINDILVHLIGILLGYSMIRSLNNNGIYVEDKVTFYEIVIKKAVN